MFSARPPVPQPAPSGSRLVKACTNCHERKVKCDGSLPVCTACYKTGLLTCNVSQHIMYQHDHVQALLDRIEWLEKAVEEAYEEGRGVKTLRTGTSLSSKSLAYVERDSRMVEEIGLLSLRGSGAYMGSMTGITLAALVNSTLQLYERPLDIPGDDPRCPAPRLRASYPPRHLAAKYIARYLDVVHRWYPFLSLSALSDTIQAIYGPATPRRTLDGSQRFTFFMLCALAGGDRQDPHAPAEYHRTAMDFLPNVLQEHSLASCRALLMLCLYSLRRPVSDEEDGVDSWLLTGHAVRLGIELGLTRNNYKAGLSEDEHEQRRRIWWSTYAMERYVATATGRVLGIRNEGIDAAFPRLLDEPLPQSLRDFMQSATCALTTINLRPALHLLSQRKLLGDVMESVYITRARARPSPTPEQTIAQVYQIQNSVVHWAEESLALTPNNSPERDILQLAFHHITLLLHRPSPTFPVPPAEVLEVCMGAARGTIRISGNAVQNGMVDAVVPGWPGFVAVFMSGLTLAYCSWAGPACTNAVPGGMEATRDPDVAISLVVLKSLGGGSAIAQRYLALYERILANLCAIIDTLPWAGPSTRALDVPPTALGVTGTYTDEGGAMAFVTENAGLQPLGGGGYELDSHAVLLVDELLAATNSLGGGGVGVAVEM